MTAFRIAIAAVALAIGLTFAPVTAAASGPQCRYTAAQYAQAIAHFETEAARARALAAQNPLYESDLAYYAAVLAEARACQRNGVPVTTASR